MSSIQQSDLVPPTAPGDGWYIIEAAGEHATRLRSESSGVASPEEEERTLVQQLTPEALAAVAAAGVPAEGLPIDRDHLSLDSDNSTEAMGWVRELALCGGNLAARIEWTSLGLPLITGRVYKHFSTVYPPPTAEQLAAGTYVPEKLIGLALTNQPNNKTGQPPITNSGGVREVRGTNSEGRSGNNGEPALAEEGKISNRQSPACPCLSGRQAAGRTIENRHSEDFSEGMVPEENQNNTTEQEPTMISPELLAALGLPEGATEAEVLAAVQSLKEQNELANTSLKAAEAAEADAVINAAEKENGVTLSDEEKQEAKQHIITNRAHGLKYVGLLCRDKRAVTNTATTERRYAGKAPLANRCTPADPEQAIANRAQQLCDEARAAGRPIGYFTAVEKARAEHARELNK